MKVEVQAVRLMAIRQKEGWAERKCADDLGISENFVPANEANDRHAGPKRQQHLMKYFRCSFEALFDVVLIDLEKLGEQVLHPKKTA